MAHRLILGAAALIAVAGLTTACGKSASSAKEGDCLDNGGMMADLNKTKIVACDSAKAKYRVSAILGPNRKQDCPKGGMFTFSWQADGKTICILPVKK
ncbi:LppU/SCO3897 family protein [Actinomadura macrotermitis]|uniref:Lipoprotein n=1 Tax=Actinomadura macrotermitis TaxID=2585200 RepID=A0A7K0BQU5_9ACTN|nr:hypothetical protein [Actinomadura macrotermitis]MQY03497.1 hypothetical protein [Actinomadura macrotermitis]